MNVSALVTGSLLGLAGSLHCVGMCGPLMLLLPTAKTWKYTLQTQGLYHLGRTLTYALLGGIAGLLFVWIDIRPFEQQFSIGLGLAFLALWVYDFWGRKYRETSPLQIWVNKAFGKALSQGASWGWFLGGMLNGLLPCGLVYGALLASLSTGTSEGPVWFMIGFGGSTAPALIGISFTKSLFIKKISPWLRTLLPFWLLLAAVLFLLRGANLGIPFLSPKFNQSPIEQAVPPCCH
jgi:sulfite exporter TauE/SafE